MICRFHDSITREQRKVQDKSCHIREVRGKLISEARKLYHLSPYGTLDKILLKFTGQCSFRHDMRSKPERYCLKFWILADARNYYCYNAMTYLGKDGEKIAVNLGATVVKKLVEPLHNSGRNVTCDRYFTGV